MTDIQNPDDIKKLVDGFYTKVRADDLLRPIFEDVAQVDWAHHLPIMYQFWEQLLFRTGGYRGAPWPKHAVLPVDCSHFERWLSLFGATVDEYFAGPVALTAKDYAQSIADTFQMRLGLLESKWA